MDVPKIAWSGMVIGVQPRIRLTRSFDQRSHSYLGYVLWLRGTIGDEQREFTVAIGAAAHEKHRFRAGDAVSGAGTPVSDPKLETAELYEASRIKLLDRDPRIHRPHRRGTPLLRRCRRIGNADTVASIRRRLT
jgi:hypothetical protein